MRTSKEYRQKAWAAIKPVLPIMLLIALVASLPQLIWLIIQNAAGLTPPDYTLMLSDSKAYTDAYTAFVASGAARTYSLVTLLVTLISIPLSLGLVGAAQRVLRGEDVLVRHSLAYLPYTFRAIWLRICAGFYAVWPILLVYLVAVVLLIAYPSDTILVVIGIALIAATVWCFMRIFLMAAVDYLMAKNPETGVSDIMRTSRTLMKGNRMRFFLLELSFVGWFLLLFVLMTLVIALTQSAFLGSVVGMLCTLLLNCYMLTAQAAFVNDLQDGANTEKSAE